MTKGKGVATEVEEAIAAVEEDCLEFNPPASAIQDDAGLKEYMAFYNDRIDDDIKVTLAPRKVDYSEAPEEEGGVYIAA